MEGKRPSRSVFEAFPEVTAMSKDATKVHFDQLSRRIRGIQESAKAVQLEAVEKKSRNKEAMERAHEPGDLVLIVPNTRLNKLEPHRERSCLKRRRHSCTISM